MWTACPQRWLPGRGGCTRARPPRKAGAWRSPTPVQPRYVSDGLGGGGGIQGVVAFLSCSRKARLVRPASVLSFLSVVCRFSRMLGERRRSLPQPEARRGQRTQAMRGGQATTISSRHRIITGQQALLRFTDFSEMERNASKRALHSGQKGRAACGGRGREGMGATKHQVPPRRFCCCAGEGRERVHLLHFHKFGWVVLHPAVDGVARAAGQGELGHFSQLHQHNGGAWKQVGQPRAGNERRPPVQESSVKRVNRWRAGDECGWLACLGAAA